MGMTVLHSSMTVTISVTGIEDSDSAAPAWKKEG